MNQSARDVQHHESEEPTHQQDKEQRKKQMTSWSHGVIETGPPQNCRLHAGRSPTHELAITLTQPETLGMLECKKAAH